MAIETILCSIVLPIIIALITSLITSLVTYRGEISKLKKQFELSEEQKRQDRRFELLGELYSLASISLGSIDLMIGGIEVLPKDEEERRILYLNRYKRAVDDYNSFSSAFIKSSPFIPKDIYELFNDIRKNNSYYINRYYDDKLSGVDLFRIEPLEKIELLKKNKDSSDKLINILDIIRTQYNGV